MSDKWSVGIIGAGDIVTQVHLPCLLSMEDIYVNWITDINHDKAKNIASAFNIKYCQLPNNLEKLPLTDLYLLAVPFGARVNYYNALRERTSALYVEKPFAKSVDFHNQICSWFPSYRLACGFQRRVDGSTQTLKQIIKNKLFGNLLHINFGFGQPGIITGGKFYSNVELAGGNILFDSAIHGIDTILFCTSATTVNIESGFMIMDKGFDLHTEAYMLIKDNLGNEFDCKIVVSCLEETIRALEFHFDTAIVAFTIGSSQVQIRPASGEDAYVMKMTSNGPLPESAYQTFYLFWSHFLQGIKMQEENLTSASRLILTTAVIEGLYKLGEKP